MAARDSARSTLPGVESGALRPKRHSAAAVHISERVNGQPAGCTRPSCCAGSLNSE